MTTDADKVVFISKHFYPHAGSRIGPQYRWTCGPYRCQYLFTQCCVMDPQRYVLCAKINCSKTLVWVIFQLISLLTFNCYSCQRRCCINNTPLFSETGMHLLVNFWFNDKFEWIDFWSIPNPMLQKSTNPNAPKTMLL